MFKYLLKMLMPSDKKLAEYAADAIAKAVNQSDKESLIARYATMANKATEIQSFVVELLVDGKIDETEKDEIVQKLIPLFFKLRELI